MKDGVEEMNWQTSADDIAWLKAINEIAGGDVKAKAIMDEFSSLVDRQVTPTIPQQKEQVYDYKMHKLFLLSYKAKRTYC